MQHTTPQLIDRLRRQIDHMPEQLQAVTKYIIDHPADFGLDSIRATADKIGVSTNAIIRLAHRMGFSRFEDFRAPFRQDLTTDREDRLGQDWLTRMADTGPFGAAQADFARNELNVVSRSLRLLDPAKVETAITLMTSAQRCFVTATRASHALAYYFHYAGRMAHPNLHLIPRHMGSAIDDLLDANQTDCLLAITIHPYSSDTIQAMRFARKQGLRLILLADSDVIAPGIDADVTLKISTRSKHLFSSFSGAMAAIEVLLGHLFAQSGDAAAERVRRYQQAREDAGAYWQPAKLPRLRSK
ncbi:transcriptional regulator, RpiR family [Ruegeria lacuscaerulensis ITI-1157]|nr:transcriptional regulator, RpiR family [Ruegeria lacuscaerulensis ITI-1157]